MKPTTAIHRGGALFGPLCATLAHCVLLGAAGPARGTAVRIDIDCRAPGPELSPHLYGLFFEDINFGADGGLYAELVQNRSFEYHPVQGNDARGRDFHPLFAWEKVERGGASCEISVEQSAPLNANNPHHLVLEVAAGRGAAGVANTGFDGIRIDEGARYDVAFHGRQSGWAGGARLTVALELADGTVCGSTAFTVDGRDWKKFEGQLTATRTADAARLVLTASGRGTLHLDMVSLFPQDTWGGRKNGLRKDLVQALADLRPKFLRFPGGCIAHGQGLANVYRWKDTVGDVAERKPNWNLWGYHQTYGLGYYEYFLLCEDLGATPLPVVPVGVTCGFRQPFDVVPMNRLQPWIDDALDLIEFANGPASSEWGGLRARMGHPEPFGLRFICLGNEEHDNREVRERFPKFVEAIRARHPGIRIIGTSGLGWQIPLYDLMDELDVHSSDEHYYEDPAWFIANQNRFDGFDRSGPMVFIGEYASRAATLHNAVAEAAYLTGVERNGDVVDMACYAPLFGNLQHCQWHPDLIYFDKRTVVRTPSYHVQQLFSCNKGDLYLPNRVTAAGDAAPPTVAGAVGIGSWGTTIEVDALAVDGRALDPAGWRVVAGDFAVERGRYVQRDAGSRPALSLSGGAFEGGTVTYRVRARTTGGTEGFLVAFGGRADGQLYWWNLGGWNNTRHALERGTIESRAVLAEAAGSVRPRTWHEAVVELSPGRIRCRLDGKLVHDYQTQPSPVSVSATLDRRRGEVIVKLVNPSADPVDARVELHGIAAVEPAAQLTVLTGDRGATNSAEAPDRVRPVTRPLRVGTGFDVALPATSVQVIRLRERRRAPAPGRRGG